MRIIVKEPSIRVYIRYLVFVCSMSRAAKHARRWERSFGKMESVDMTKNIY